MISSIVFGYLLIGCLLFALMCYIHGQPESEDYLENFVMVVLIWPIMLVLWVLYLMGFFE